MLSPKMNDTLNEQVKWELYSSYLYLGMAAWCSQKGLPGFASWMRMQAQEELFHALKFYDYILERGGATTLFAIDAPTQEWETPLAVFEYALNHEYSVTKRINDLMDVAHAERDHACAIFLQWFVTEQVEEEDSFNDILAKLRLIGGQGEGLFMMDKELATRPAPTPPAA
ncbi:ferritin [Megalodesulfovibrio gigas]|uniref:Ferritin n=1 Tax=Megalodesulfovibrio gigas (strain ATCC 19364 / DSM 1382 / NCIMB 9332 / VKM B-1759) TaxID=1121448 RepID=T2GC97_MEGG1|nr:ferritin [Megalodesulfovibrio gigas]AGW13532.1 putative ferroxidase [Megalodesulfovibrio gigas DSM 1382 = ATCC 19364]